MPYSMTLRLERPLILISYDKASRGISATAERLVTFVGIFKKMFKIVVSNLSGGPQFLNVLRWKRYIPHQVHFRDETYIRTQC